MGADLMLFIPLAVLTNTAFPLPFEPVLLWFAGRHGMWEACAFALFGSGCAGVAGLVDLAVIGGVSRRWHGGGHRAAPMPRAGVGFYVAAAVVALLPVPYTTIRLALLTARPRPVSYALIVSLSRLPRYLMLVWLWQGLALPGWAGGVLVLPTAVWAVWSRRRRKADGRLGATA